MGWYHILTLLCLGFHNVESIKYNYGVYFEEAGPWPNNLQNPAIGSGLTVAEPPSDWNKVDSMYYPYDWSAFFKQYPKEFIRNKCENRAQSECEPNCDYYDSHQQSPIQVQFDPSAPKCDDRHSFHHPIDGTCNDGEISFKVTPTGLRADLNCTERPNLDLSRNADFWEMRAIELKVPAEHEQKLENGTVLTYDAEIQMVHTGTGLHEHEFNIVSVWIKAVSGATKSAELEKYLLKWEDAQEKQYARCDKRFIESKCSIENGYVPSTSAYYEWETITLDTFEPFTELHYIGGAQTLISRFEGFTSSGVKAMRIRSDGDSARFWHKIDYDVRKFNSLEVRFFVYAKKVRNQDAFLLEYSSDGGKSFNEIKTWVVPKDIQIDGAGNWNSTQTVFITRNDYKEAFSKNFRLAFRSKTSSTSRQFYIDDIEFLGNQAPLESLEETTSMDLIDNTMMNLCTSNTLETCCTGHIVPYWSLITNDEFENGWGNFKGTDTTNAMLSGYTGCENGSKCVRLRDASANSTAALFSHYQSHDVTSFTELKVQFHFRTAGLDKGQTDGFALDYSDNNGVDDSWVEIQKWSMIDNSIVNDQSIRQVITISRNEVNFSSTARLRFRAIDTSPSDNVYIDSISFSGLYDPSDFCKNITDLCCKRQLQENNSLLRGSVKESEATPSSSSSRIDHFREKTPRYLTSTEDSGYLCVDAEDYFCPYALFRETKNPHYYRYYGSLTSPPCTERVSWRVMVAPLIISEGQLRRLEDLTSKYLEYPSCRLETWGKPREDGSCHVDVNRPVQYLTDEHSLEDCEKYNEGPAWVFESAAMPVSDGLKDKGNTTAINTAH